jgi:polygalacturonase
MPALLVAVAAVFALSQAATNAPPLSIDSFGALPGNNTYEAALTNGLALLKAMTAANQGFNDSRSVLIPAGSDYYMLPSNSSALGFANMNDVTLILDGTVWVWTDDIKLWPQVDGRAINFMLFTNCSNINLIGNGVIEGQGYGWWWYVILTGIDNRPTALVNMYLCRNVYFAGWTLYNSPQYHVFFQDVIDSNLYNLTIHVDVENQAQLLDSFGLLSTGDDGMPKGIPTFPLNTDGIDISGRNVTVRHCRIKNFDDSVCLKPSNGNDIQATCTENILFEDIDITLGVGASTGSVPPHTPPNCIRNCTFRDIRFTSPIKAIYIKPNPGTTGSGIIDGIVYENIVATDALWWSIWVSTQQQHQPGGGANTHCSFFFPLFNSTCQTQPLVPVTNLVVRNVTMTGALLSPGVLRCNDTNPCTGWLFEDVNISSATNFPAGDAFICEGIVDSTGINVSPGTSACFNSGSSAKRQVGGSEDAVAQQQDEEEDEHK